MLIHRKVRLCDLLLRSPNKRQSPGLGGRTSSIYIWDSRPNPVIVVILLPAQRKDSYVW